ncbi:MAG: BRO family protein [Prevotella koreensis]|uniref:BRO family protein n=1 Tax=Prevotella koreensis TaxID=2490854 RepID=UPI003FA06383
MSNKETTAGETAMQVFTWNESDVQIRSKIIDGTPWLVAKDLCDYLELNDVSKALERLDDDEKLTRKFFVSGQMRSMWLVNESGTYALILRSNKPKAREFRKWITSEVLPTLRKTGRYELCPPSPRRSVRKTRGEGVNVELTNLLWLIGESLVHGDQAAVALELGVSRIAVSRVLNGLNRSSRILMALYQRARQNRERDLLYYSPGVMADRLLGRETLLPTGNPLPTVQVVGKKGGKYGNQNARKHWGKEGV